MAWRWLAIYCFRHVAWLLFNGEPRLADIANITFEVRGQGQKIPDAERRLFICEPHLADIATIRFEVRGRGQRIPDAERCLEDCVDVHGRAYRTGIFPSQ